MSKKGLGKGLGALISEINDDINDEKDIRELKINEIEPNNKQPRKYFDDDKLKELSESIKKHGIVQPIIVKKENESYKIVAGERRWRAARIAGFSSVPVIVRELSNKQVMEIALIENIQREDLNPIEEAEAYENLIKEYEITQDELSKIIGKSRSLIANTMRLNNLCDEVKKLVISGQISNGHARAILSLDSEEMQTKAAKEIIEKDLNVRDTEKLVKNLHVQKKEIKENKKVINENNYVLEERLKEIYGTKVNLVNKRGKGKIIIEYYSSEELERLIELSEKINKI